jgi:hypothetical protein
MPFGVIGCPWHLTRTPVKAFSPTTYAIRLSRGRCEISYKLV